MQFTHNTKGGTYILLENQPKPAGLAKQAETIVIYQCVTTQQTYWRTEADFYTSMRPLINTYVGLKLANSRRNSDV